MIDALNAVETDALGAIEQAVDEDSIRNIEVQYLGKKGAITALLKGMRDVAPEDRRSVGQRVNEVRSAVEGAIETRRARLDAEADCRFVRRPALRCYTAGHSTTHWFDSSPDRGDLPYRRCVSRHGFHLLDYPEIESVL